MDHRVGTTILGPLQYPQELYWQESVSTMMKTVVKTVVNVVVLTYRVPAVVQLAERTTILRMAFRLKGSLASEHR